MKVRRKWRKNFVQNDSIRNKFDSYAVIASMAKNSERRKKEASFMSNKVFYSGVLLGLLLFLGMLIKLIPFFQTIIENTQRMM